MGRFRSGWWRRGAVAGVVLLAGGALALPVTASAVTAGPARAHGSPAAGGRVAVPGPSAQAAKNTQADQHFGVLQDVYCTATTNCWAVGFQGLTEHAQVNQVLHWNGRTWYHVTTPNPGGSASDDESALAAVRCVTARDCWAVGDTYHNDIERNQALHWNGRRWSVARTPNPGGSSPGLISELADVTCVTSANCWAVGEFTAGINTLLNEVLHWNGKRWSQVQVVNPAGTKSGAASELYAVRCGSAHNCNAGGDYGRKVAPQRNELLHWNGTRWSRVGAPNPAGTGSSDANDLQALACGGGTNCWAAGYASTDKIHNEMLHWNGRSWSTATVPNPNGNTPLADDQLFGATCSSTRNCWAVGQQDIEGSTAITNEALRWNGKRWSLIPTPDPGGTGSVNDQSTLLGVRCTGPSSCWAVGKQSTASVYQNEILFWNGRKWSVY